MDKGIYCLVFRHPACTLIIGARGALAFPAGFHIYIGSALGSGGLKRLDRHCRLACEGNKRPKWHVDYILTDPRFSLVYAVSAPTTERLECRLAETLRGNSVKGFGCSDCTCTSHLLYRCHDPKEEIVAAFGTLGLLPAIKTMITQQVKGNI
jgi:Uri superfamily endonuclease